jgi:LssY C-terminus
MSCASAAGQKIEAKVNAAVIAGGRVVIPAGTLVRGKVKSATTATAADQRSVLLAEFTEVVDAAGKAIPISTGVLEVDNARETVDDNGEILGILESETLTARMDQGLEKLAEGKLAKLASVLQVAKGAVLQKADTRILYEPGVELQLKLAKPAEVKGKFPQPDVAAIEPFDELYNLVNAIPFQTTAAKPPKPSDVTNLMYIGTREQIEKAFADAGWVTAEALSAQSGLETVRAVAENRGYKEAPMSILLLEGKAPDMVFQKQLNTFAKRHHLRIFGRPEKFRGREVWVCAATHDIGIEFSPENRTFIHKIDSTIDRERAKVVSDLLLTTHVKGLALVERPAVPTSSQNATGDKLETDGAMAVMVLE